MTILYTKTPIITSLSKPGKVKNYFNARQILALRFFGLTLGEIFFLNVLTNHHRRLTDVKTLADNRFKGNQWACWFRSINTALQDWRGGDRQLRSIIDLLKGNNLVIIEKARSDLFDREVTKIIPNYKKIYGEIFESDFHIYPKSGQKSAETTIALKKIPKKMTVKLVFQISFHGLR